MVLAVRFATRTIKGYGLNKQKIGNISHTHFLICEVYSLCFSDMPDNLVKLHEMAFLLGVIRSIQGRITAKSQNSTRMVRTIAAFFTIHLPSNVFLRTVLKYTNRTIVLIGMLCFIAGR